VLRDRSEGRWRRYLDSLTFEESPQPLRALLEFGFIALRKFLTIEGAQQATVLAAQAFTSLIPLMVVVAAFAPGNSDLADRIVERFGLEGNSAKSVHELFASAGETQSTITWISVVILVLSALSFTRALQRVFQRAYDRQPEGLKDQQRGLAWVLCLAAWVTIVSPLHESLEDVGGIVFAVALATATGFLLWLGTPVLLLGEREWRRLVSGALVSGLLGAVLSVGSSIYVPILMDWSAGKYGLIGVAFALQSWLLLASFVVVIGAVVGAVVVERYGALSLRRLRNRSRR
jgi:membrane protein